MAKGAGGHTILSQKLTDQRNQADCAPLRIQKQIEVGFGLHVRVSPLQGRGSWNRDRRQVKSTINFFVCFLSSSVVSLFCVVFFHTYSKFNPSSKEQQGALRLRKANIYCGYTEIGSFSLEEFSQLLDLVCLVGRRPSLELLKLILLLGKYNSLDYSVALQFVFIV